MTASKIFPLNAVKQGTPLNETKRTLTREHNDNEVYEFMKYKI